jgi:hypothetical protein
MTAETATQARPSPWPVAEETLASLPASRYLWVLSLPVRGASEAERAEYAARVTDAGWASIYGPAPAACMAPPPVIQVAVRPPAVVPAQPLAAAPVPDDVLADEGEADPEPPAPVSPEDAAEQRSKAALAAWTPRQGEPSGVTDTGPAATAVIPAAGAHTEIVPAITGDEGGQA